jgi:DNA-binding NarL/FixJ family response regulator
MQQIPQHSSTNARMKQDHRRDSTNALLLNKRQWLYVQTRYKLTPRERQIAELICQGLRNGKIANYLRIRPGTVKTHVRNIYRKAQVRSKIAMLLKFVTDAKAIHGRYNTVASIHISNTD